MSPGGAGPILLVDSKPLFAGGQRMLAALCGALAGHAPIVVRPTGAADPPGAFAPARVVAIGFPSYPPGMSRPAAQAAMLPGVARTAWRLRRILRRVRPRLVVANDLYALIPLRLALAGSGIPCVLYVHSCDLPRNRAVGWLVRGCRRIVACAEAVRRHVAWTGVPAVVVANAVALRPAGAGPSLRRTLGWDGDWVLGFVGRIDANKNLAGLLRAFARALPAWSGEGRPARLLVIGDGEERSAMAALALELGLADRVAFAGWQDEPHRHVADLDALALVSRSEASPLAVIEAQLLGVPVLATAVGGVPELIADGRTGILAPDGGVDALRDGLLRLRAVARSSPLVAAARRRAECRHAPAAYAAAMARALRLSRPATRRGPPPAPPPG